MPIGIRRLFTRSSSDKSRPDSTERPSGASHAAVNPMPVILISFNRGEMLEKVVDGYKKQSVAVEIFVHDNGSDDPATTAVLDKLEQDGIVIFRRDKITSPDELDLVDESVQEVFRERTAGPYAVSDCDVSIAESSPATLATYLRFLDEMPEIDCAGPMLRIDDVPATYPLYYAMLNRHILQFWGKEPQFRSIDGVPVGYLRAPIDTTLAVYRAGAPYRRLRRGVRLYQPFAARHLDWYPDEHRSAYRASTDGSTISNWSNPARERNNRYQPLEYQSYWDVVTGDGGALTTVARAINFDHNVPTDVLQGLVDDVRERLRPSRGGVLGRAWVWRDCVGVLEADVAVSARLGFDLFATQEGRWACFAVARTGAMRSMLVAAGFEEGSSQKFFVGLFDVDDDGVPAAAEIAAAYDDVIARILAV